MQWTVTYKFPNEIVGISTKIFSLTQTQTLHNFTVLNFTMHSLSLKHHNTNLVLITQNRQPWFSLLSILGQWY